MGRRLVPDADDQVAELQSKLREQQVNAEALVDDARRATDDVRRQLEKVLMRVNWPFCVDWYICG